MSDIPFSFAVDVAALPPKGRDYDLTAKPQEREAIARALGLESLGSLNAQLEVVPGAGGAVTVTGSLVADVVQACVVTLAPVPAHIAEPIARTFVPAPVAKPASKRKEKPADEEADGWVDPNAQIMDPLINGVIDLGEVVTEQLALALNPYPRAPGATFGGTEADATGKESPFAGLAALKLSKAVPRRGRAKSANAAKRRPAKGKTGG